MKNLEKLEADDLVSNVVLDEKEIKVLHNLCPGLSSKETLKRAIERYSWKNQKEVHDGFVVLQALAHKLRCFTAPSSDEEFEMV